MLFNSIHYLLFFPLVVLLYFNTPPRARWCLLFLASCYFYMAFIPQYILFLFAIILIDYVAAILIESAPLQRKKMFLGWSIAANLGILFFFKYLNFVSSNLEFTCEVLGLHAHFPTTSLVLPLGLSFHTFQSLAYTIEVYRGNFAAERHLGIYACYVLFFPQLVAGPIERPAHLLPQLRRSQEFRYAAACSGMRLILIGLCKKILVADNLAVWVDKVYYSPSLYGGPVLTLATVLFAFQIYCDFSGYTDIARGSAKIMGIDLVNNFDRPYLARSIAEFWHRWHISLSSWFRDYVYFPLGGSRVPLQRHLQNLMAVFLVSGLWHGANWTYLIWGGLHGTYLVTAVLWGRRFPRPVLGTAWRTVGTFVAVTFAWIFFRANTLGDAFYVASHCLTGWTKPSLETLGMTRYDCMLCTSLITGLLALEAASMSGWLRFDRMPRSLRWACYYAGLLMIVFLGKFEAKQFIYFQF